MIYYSVSNLYHSLSHRELAEKDPEKSIVLHIFIQSVNRE